MVKSAPFPSAKCSIGLFPPDFEPRHPWRILASLVKQKNSQ
jgi:hypothetical protein